MADDIGNIIGAITGILTLKQWIIAAIIVFALWKLTSKKEKFATMPVAQTKQVALDHWNGWNAMPESNEKAVMKANVLRMKSDLDAVMKSETSTNVNRLNGSLSKVMSQIDCLKSKPWIQCVTFDGRQSGGVAIG